jgi:hypothetical protein
VAGSFGWGTHRRERGAFKDIEAAAREMSMYMLRLPPEARGRLPTHRELIDAGRGDLIYALKVS